MATRQIAQGLAGLGRYGDSMLMHVSPDEVAGLQSLGKTHGVSLTTNPHTGLPEAFSFGNFFKAIAPTIAGIVAAPATGGMSLAPILAGAGTGAAIAAASGDNILTGGLMGGLGGYGGGNLAGGIQGMGAAGANTAGAAEMGTATLNAAPGVTETVASAATPDAVAAVTPQVANETAANIAKFGAMDGGMGAAPTFEGMGQGLANIGQEGSWDAFKAGMGPNTTNMQAATSIGLPLGAGYLSGAMPTMEEPEKDKYDPNKSLNLSGDTGLRLGAGDSGLRLLAMGGSTNLYGNPDGTAAQNTLNENYGIGRLDRLAQASADSGASQYQFAEGGNVGKQVNLSTRSGLSEPQGGTQGAGGIFTPMGWIGRDIPERSPESNGIFTPMGWIGRDIPERKSGSNGIFTPLGWMGRDSDEPASGEYVDLDSPTGLNLARGGLADGGFVVPADVVSHLGNGSTDAGLQHLQNRMGARPIRGAGDGMSDSIKTTIEGKQPARIANGEAYIPPEVVKQRGGAKNLYKMMDKVRKERTGSTKQGKQINPSKYLPA